MSSTKKRAGGIAKKQWTVIDAQEALDACARSGLSIERFAQREGYSGQRLRNWKKRLGGSAEPATTEFVPVTIAARSHVLSRESFSNVSVECAGVTLRVPEDVDASRLAELVQALGWIVRAC